METISIEEVLIWYLSGVVIVGIILLMTLGKEIQKARGFGIKTFLTVCAFSWVILAILVSHLIYEIVRKAIKLLYGENIK